MPKRNNPFGDHSCLQLKTHIREKEVNNGVCQQTRMQSVYDKTRQLLFDGMKRNQGGVVAKDANFNNCLEKRSHGDIPNMFSEDETSSLKQMHLNKNCQLVTDSDSTDSTSMDTCDAASLNSAFSKLPVDSIPHIENKTSVFSFSNNFAPAQSLHCQSFSLPNFSENTFSRTPSEFSPPAFASSSHDALFSSNVFHGKLEAGPSTSDNLRAPSQNAFLTMMQAQSKERMRDANTFSPLSRACHSCRQPVACKDVMKCQFCESYVCVSCTRQCSICLCHYCQLCSMLNYEQSIERVFCLSCKRR